jgi:shikimate dehydrogenase
MAFSVEEAGLAQILPAMRTLGFRGINVTVPLKEKVTPFLATVSEEAGRIGAVNTLLNGPSGWEGYNTDAPGFADAYLKELDPCPALVLGAGGAARAVLSALLDTGFRPTVCARRREKAEGLARHFTEATSLEVGVRPWEDPGGPWRLVVNALSVSSPEELGPSPPTPGIEPGGLVADLNYGRPENFFRELALSSGAGFRDGLLMLACQARLSFIRWTGRNDIPLDPFLDGATSG